MRSGSVTRGRRLHEIPAHQIAAQRREGVAVATFILAAKCPMLKAMYDDLGPSHCDRRAKEWQQRRRVQGQTALGFGGEGDPARAALA